MAIAGPASSVMMRASPLAMWAISWASTASRPRSSVWRTIASLTCTRGGPNGSCVVQLSGGSPRHTRISGVGMSATTHRRMSATRTAASTRSEPGCARGRLSAAISQPPASATT